MEHFYRTIPGWCDFADYYAHVVESLADGAHIVEVGVWQGCSTAALAVEIANSGKAIRLDVVDHFKGSPETPQLPHQRAAFDQHTAPVAHLIRSVLEAPSWQAADQYADGSLDFVFLDADHSSDALLKDLTAWWPKIKPGGLLAGHDADWPSVQRALMPWVQLVGGHCESVSVRCWEVRKPHATVPMETPAGQRKLLVAVCSNERSIYRQTAKSLIALGWGQRVTTAAARHGFADISFAWFDQFTLVSDLRNDALSAAAGLGYSHVLFLDADMTWPSDLLDRILAHHDRGIVGGLYYLKAWPHPPVAFQRARVNPKTWGVDYDHDWAIRAKTALVPVDLLGMGCTLVPTSVCAVLPPPWFEYWPDARGRMTITEDVAFCRRAAAHGVPLWIDPTIECGHIGQPSIVGVHFDRARHDLALLERVQTHADAHEGVPV